MERDKMLGTYLNILNEYRAEGLVSEEEMKIFVKCFIEAGTHLPSNQAEFVFERALEFATVRKDLVG